MDTVYYWRLKSSTCTPDIFTCTLLKFKKHKGSYNRKAKKFKTSNRNIKNRDAPILKLATNGIEVFVNTPWASFCANGCFVEHKVEAVTNA